MIGLCPMLRSQDGQEKEKDRLQPEGLPYEQVGCGVSSVIDHVEQERPIL